MLMAFCMTGMWAQKGDWAQLERYSDDLRQIYSRHQAGNHQPDFARHRRLENEMSEAAKSLFKE